MSSQAIRDPQSDHLLTPHNAALLVIDFQPPQVNSIGSMDRQQLVDHIVGCARAAILYGLPIVHTTVNVKTGLNQPPVPQLRQALSDYPSYDRTNINSWEDTEFVRAVEQTGRRKLIMAGLWTDACLLFPALDALAAGYEVFAVVDASGATSPAGHDAALRRIEQAGGRLVSTMGLFCELQRDWNRSATVPGFVDLFIQTGGNAGIQFSNDQPA